MYHLSLGFQFMLPGITSCCHDLGDVSGCHDQDDVVLGTSLYKISIDKEYYSLPIQQHIFLSKKDHVHIYYKI